MGTEDLKRFLGDWGLESSWKQAENYYTFDILEFFIVTLVTEIPSYLSHVG